MYKLVRTGPGWARILWRHDSRPSPEVAAAMEKLTQVPGVSLFDPGAFELPCTTWHLPEVDELAYRCRVELPYDEDPKFPGSRSALRLGDLYEHQFSGAQWLTDRRGGGLLADEMGLGKTRTAATAAELIRMGKKDGCVVIVGPLFTRDVWRRELLESGAITQADQFCALLSRDLHDPSFRKGARYYFVHYDVAAFWWSRIAQLRPVVAIADEAHWVRNGRALRSKGANLVLGPCPHRFLLTGTPLENKPADLWHLLTLATGPRTWGGPVDFRRRYCGAVHDGYGWRDGEPSNVAELRARMAPFYLRRTVEDTALSLPGLTRRTQSCEVPAGVQEVVRALEPEKVRELVRAVANGSVQQVLPVLTELWQATSRDKIPATAAYVQNALDQGESVVVFVWEREVAHRLAGCLSTSFTVTGENRQGVRDGRVQAFQDAREPTALIATYGALREGVTLHRSRLVVLHDLHWLLTTILQAEARIYRIGQKRACQSIWMVAEGTIDALLAPVLRMKAEAMSLLLSQDSGLDALTELDLAVVSGAETVEQQVDAALQTWRTLRRSSSTPSFLRTGTRSIS